MSKFLNLIKALGFNTAADAAVQVGVSTDTQPRLQIDAGGKHTWGAGGSSAGDTTLYRSAADTLKTDDAFIAAGGLTIKTIEVDTASASAGQVLTFNGTKFAPTNATGGATVSDTAPSSPSTGQVWFESDTGKTFIYYDSTWVEVGGGGGASVTVSDTPPASPSEGNLWYESDTGSVFIYYDTYWVDISNSAVYNALIGAIQAKGDLLVGDASQSMSRIGVGANGTRLTADSTTATGVAWKADTQNTVIDAKGDLLAGTSADTLTRVPVGTNGQTLIADSTQSAGVRWLSPAVGFRNKIINGGFDIWQRGTSFSNPANGDLTADRWKIVYNGTGATRTISQQTFTPGTAPASNSGYEGTYFLRCAVTAAGTGNTVQRLEQRIEDVRTLAGQTVTVSFWAKADASRNIQVDLGQNFGTGGSSLIGTVNTVSINTTWTRYQVTVNNFNLVGKTIGTNSYLYLYLSLPAATACTVDFWGVQVEGNSSATDFELRPYGVELGLCQRYYQRYGGSAYEPLSSATFYTAAGVFSMFRFISPMRISPVLNVSNTSHITIYSNNAGYLINSISTWATSNSTTGMGIYITTTNNGTQGASAFFTLNTTTGWIDFSAEL